MVGPGFGCQSDYGVFGPSVQNFEEKSLEPENGSGNWQKIGTSPKTWFIPGFGIFKISTFKFFEKQFVRHVVSLRKIIKVLNNKNDINNNNLREGCGAHYAYSY